MKKKENFSFVAIAHWPFRLGLAAAASDFALMWMGGPTARRIVVLLSFVALLRKKKSMCSAKIFIALMPGIHHSPHGGKFKKTRNSENMQALALQLSAQHNIHFKFVATSSVVRFWFSRGPPAKSAVKLRNLGTIEN